MGVDGGFLTTGDVAARLGASRQHVVNLCERGDIRFVMVGKHRRIPQSEVGRVLGTSSMNREDALSLWLHRAVVGHLVTNPAQVVNAARLNLEARLAKDSYGGSSRSYALRWQQVLDEGAEKVAEVLTDLNEEARTLRSCTPFVGILSSDERALVLESFKNHWREERAGVR